MGAVVTNCCERTCGENYNGQIEANDKKVLFFRSLIETKKGRINQILLVDYDIGFFKLYIATEKPEILVYNAIPMRSQFELNGELKGHSDSVTSLAVENTFEIGKHKKLVSCSLDKLIKIWDCTTDECIATIEGQEKGILKVLCFNSKLISYSMDGIIKSFSTETFKEDVPTCEEDETNIEEKPQEKPLGNYLISMLENGNNSVYIQQDSVDWVNNPKKIIDNQTSIINNADFDNDINIKLITQNSPIVTEFPINLAELGITSILVNKPNLEDIRMLVGTLDGNLFYFNFTKEIDDEDVKLTEDYHCEIKHNDCITSIYNVVEDNTYWFTGDSKGNVVFWKKNCHKTLNEESEIEVSIDKP